MLNSRPESFEAGVAADSRHVERNPEVDISGANIFFCEVSRLTSLYQSAAPAAFCALINLVCSQAGNASATSNGWSMCAIISNTILPKLYAISAMWTLNSRKDIRLARSNGQTTSSGDGPSGRRRTNNVELGVISGGARNIPIQVRTQVQTIQRADDIFSKSHLDAMDKMDAERDSNKDIDSTKE